MRRRRSLGAAVAATLLMPMLQVAQAMPAQAADEPTITVHAPDGAWEGWYRRQVNIQVNATARFPLAILTWQRTRPDGTTDSGNFDPNGTGFQVATRGATNFTFQATDMFGATSQAKYGVGIDPDAPTISFDNLDASIVVGQGAIVPFTYSCSEDLTLVKSCAAPTPSGQPLRTSTLGTSNETVRAEDMVGNVRTRTLNYEVVAPLQLAAPPRITGTARAGETLTYTGGTFTPAAEVTAEWFRGAARVGTGATYAVTDADVGHALTIKVTGRRLRFADAEATSAATSAVQKRLFTSTGTLEVRGEPVIGRQLSLSLPDVSPGATSTSFQWYRNGGAIAGATSPIYAVTSADANSTLSAGVVFGRDGYDSLQRFTTATAMVLAALTVDRQVRVRGTAMVGRSLVADAPLFSGLVDRMSYRWLRNGSPIAGATSTSYRLAAADVGRRITVRVVAQSSRRPDVESRSGQTAAVAKATTSMSARAKARGKGRVQIRVSVTASGFVPTGKVTIMRGSKVIARNKTLTRGRLTVNLVRQPTKKVTYTVKYLGSGVTKPVSKKVRP